ncbi:hypothetical protein L0222_26770 [bacterium]|nr:hypothetical protein [bacterium]MCI0605472.1 hypothetical protein [bacterium]
MKIQIRRGSQTSKNATLKIREKIVYQCKECKNRYYSYYYFCPQCLGEVASPAHHSATLQILTCPSDEIEAADFLKKLSGKNDFDFAKALRALPWTCLISTDSAILQHWKVCLEAQKFTVEVLPSPPETKKKRRKPHPPLFETPAPFPGFFPSSISSAIRKAAQAIPMASARLQWVDTVLLSFKILEGLYKHPTGRILFYDFIFQIEEEFREFLQDFSRAKWSEAEFLKQNGKLKASFERMDVEVQEVRQQVQEQL